MPGPAGRPAQPREFGWGWWPWIFIFIFFFFCFPFFGFWGVDKGKK